MEKTYKELDVDIILEKFKYLNNMRGGESLCRYLTLGIYDNGRFSDEGYKFFLSEKEIVSDNTKRANEIREEYRSMISGDKRFSGIDVVVLGVGVADIYVVCLYEKKI